MKKLILILVVCLLVFSCKCNDCDQQNDAAVPSASAEVPEAEVPKIQAYWVQESEFGAVTSSGEGYKLTLNTTDEYQVSGEEKHEVSKVTFFNEAFTDGKAEAELTYDKIKGKTVVKLSNSQILQEEEQVVYEATLIEGDVLAAEMRNVVLKIKDGN